jgi:DNA-directed RNA polymerase specialized sigma24 family protein
VTPADATCWTLIGAAAGGDVAARDDFARRYQPVARDYFAARWHASPLRSAVDDAVQDVFVECFKPNGVLGKASESPGDGFRPFFHGVLRNVARRHEERHKPAVAMPEDLPADDASLGRAFDQAWAKSMLREAARVQAELATGNERAMRRVELLRVRFQEGLPIRDIAVRWHEDAAKLHHEYATAREEFRAALQRVMAFHMPAATAVQVDAACRDLLALLA